MQVLPRSRGRLRYLHTSVRSYATFAETRNARINAFVHLANDSEPSRTSPDGPLSGMTVAVKDNICTSDMPTTCSSLMLKGSPTTPSRLPNWSSSPHRLFFPVRRNCCTTSPNFGSENCRKNKLRRVWNGVRSFGCYLEHGILTAFTVH